MTEVPCPTCVTTRVEPHPRISGVLRCSNCKEHLGTKSSIRHEKFLKYAGGEKYVYFWDARCGSCPAKAYRFWTWDIAATWLKIHWREHHGSTDR